MEASICIATHKRPESLRRLLASLASQRAAPRFDVVIVDNDSSRSAEPAAIEFQDRLSLTYLVEEQRGLARVRNRAVSLTGACFLAFIDDDEWAMPGWLAALHRVAQESVADVVIGRVQVIFAPQVPTHIRNCGLFDELKLADGDPLPWYATRTGNAYVRRSALPDLQAPFDNRFNFTGGEDVDLFKRMIDAGARVRAAPSALVLEDRPLSRANLRWIIRRALRNGAAIANLEWRQAPPNWRLSRGFRAAGAGFASVLAAGACWWWDRSRGTQFLIRGGEEFGKLAHVAGIQIQEYRTHL